MATFTREQPIPNAQGTLGPGSNWKIGAAFSLFSLLFLLAGIFVGARFRPGFRSHTSDSAAVVTQIKQLNQLVTVRYSIQRVVGITEPKDPFGAESILLMVQGEALAGVDLASMTQRDVIYSGVRSVTVTLPPAKLFNAFLDENKSKVWDRHVTWWTPWVPYDQDLEHRARLSALNEVRDAALAMGILDHARNNAESVIRDFLRALNIDVSFKRPAT
jgi:Protein of unknown function (DUF4230)